ncbi:hypothetical protein DPE44_10350 [Salmonella enterica subsp. salamae]|nr:hypothetical protein [Salmonella enterica subsp. salamae]
MKFKLKLTYSVWRILWIWLFQRQVISCEAAQNIWRKRVEALNLYLHKEGLIDDRNEPESR